MAGTGWKLDGDYFEACNCDYLCPCVPSGMTARPTHGHCDVGLVFHVDRGRFGDTQLDGLNFALLVRTPGVMAEGNWTVGVVLDERANDAQRQALTTIVSGQAGGPPAALGPLLGTFAGAEVLPITYESDGLHRAVSIPGLLDLAIDGAVGADGKTPMQLENAPHPANSTLALAHASRSHMHAFGIDWDDTSGRNNGHFAPFSWSG